MFDALKNFLAGLASDMPRSQAFDEHDYRLAAVALLCHLADVDGVVDERERSRIRQLVAERYGLGPFETARLVAEAEKSDRQSVDLYQFTSTLKRHLDAAGRLGVISMMWEIAWADGHVDEFEDNTIWRVAELLGVSQNDRIALKQKVVARNSGADNPGDV